MDESDYLYGTFWETNGEEKFTDLKLKINQFIFLNGNPAWTLAQAERAAVAIFEMLIEPPDNPADKKAEQ